MPNLRPSPPVLWGALELAGFAAVVAAVALYAPRVALTVAGLLCVAAANVRGRDADRGCG